MLSLLILLLGLFRVAGLGIVLLSAEDIIEEIRERGRAVREIIVVAASLLSREILHLLSEIARAELLHQAVDVAALHEGIHLILDVFKILVGNAHLAYQVLYRLDFQLLGTAEAIADRRRVLGIIICNENDRLPFSASAANHSQYLILSVG